MDANESYSTAHRLLSSDELASKLIKKSRGAVKTVSLDGHENGGIKRSSEDQLIVARDELRSLKGTLLRQEEDNRALRSALRRQDELIKRKDKELAKALAYLKSDKPTGLLDEDLARSSVSEEKLAAKISSLEKTAAESKAELERLISITKYKKLWEVEAEKEHYRKETVSLREEVLKVSELLKGQETKLSLLQTELSHVKRKNKKLKATASTNQNAQGEFSAVQPLIEDEMLRLQRFAELERDLAVNVNGPRKAKELAKAELFARQQDAALAIQSKYREWGKGTERANVEGFLSIVVHSAQLAKAKAFPASTNKLSTSIELRAGNKQLVIEKLPSEAKDIMVDLDFDCKLLIVVKDNASYPAIAGCTVVNVIDILTKNKVLKAETIQLDYPDDALEKRGSYGSVTLSISFLTREEKERASNKAKLPKDGIIRIRIKSATDIRKTQGIGRQEPVLRLVYRDQIQTTACGAPILLSNGEAESETGLGETFAFPESIHEFEAQAGQSAMMVLQVMDRVLKNSVIGAAEIPLSSVFSHSGWRSLSLPLTHKDAELTRRGEGLGQIQLELSFMEKSRFVQKCTLNTPTPKSGVLRIQVHRAFDLALKSSDSSGDPYAVVTFSGQRYKSQIIHRGGRSPSFPSNSVAEFIVKQGDSTRIFLCLFDDSNLRDQLIGATEFSALEAIEKGGKLHELVELSYADMDLEERRTSGRVELSLAFLHAELHQRLLESQKPLRENVVAEIGILGVFPALASSPRNASHVGTTFDHYDIELDHGSMPQSCQWSPSAGQTRGDDVQAHGDKKLGKGKRVELALKMNAAGLVRIHVYGHSERKAEKVHLGSGFLGVATMLQDGRRQTEVDVPLEFADVELFCPQLTGKVKLEISLEEERERRRKQELSRKIDHGGHLRLQPLSLQLKNGRPQDEQQSSTSSSLPISGSYKLVFNLGTGTCESEHFAVGPEGKSTISLKGWGNFLLQKGDCGRLTAQLISTDGSAKIVAQVSLGLADTLNAGKSVQLPCELLLVDHKGQETQEPHSVLLLSLSFLDETIIQRRTNLEKPLERNGIVRVEALRCYDLKQVQILGEQDPYVAMQLGDNKWKTATAEDGGRNPVFANACHDFQVKKGDSGRLIVRVLDDNNLADSVIGCLELGLSELVNGEPGDGRTERRDIYDLDFSDYDLQYRGKNGKIELSLAFIGEEVLKKREECNAPIPLSGELQVQILRCFDLRDVQLLGSQDPFVKLQYLEQRFRSETAENGGRYPSFSNATTLFSLKKGDPGRMVVQVMDENAVKDSVIGATEIGLAHILEAISSSRSTNHSSLKQVYELDFADTALRKPMKCGKIELLFSFIDEVALKEQEDSLRPVSRSGVVRVQVHRAFGLQEGQLVGKQDPYVQMQLGKEKYRGEVAEDGGENPVFPNVIHDFFVKKGESGQLLLRLWDDNNLRDSLIGCTAISIEPYIGAGEGGIDQREKTFTVPLEYKDLDMRKREGKGRLELSIAFMDEATAARHQELGKVVKMAGVVRVQVHSCVDLKDVESIGKQDPYVEILHGSQVYRTKPVINGGRNPVFHNETHDFELKIGDLATLLVRVYDKDTVGENKLIGATQIGLSRCLEGGKEGKEEKGLYPLDFTDLELSKREDRGRVQLSLAFLTLETVHKQQRAYRMLEKEGQVKVQILRLMQLEENRGLLSSSTMFPSSKKYYVRLFFGEQELKSGMVAVQDGQGEFTEEQNLFLEVKKGEAGALKLILVEDSLLNDPVRGATLIALSDVVNGSRHVLQTAVDLEYQDLQLTKPKLCGKIELCFSFKGQDELRREARLRKTLDQPGLLRVKVTRATNLRNVEITGQTQDPYVHLVFGSESFRSSATIDGGRNPIFSSACTDFKVKIGDPAVLLVKVMDANAMFDSLIGGCRIPLDEIVLGTSVERANVSVYELEPTHTGVKEKEKGSCGQVEVSLQFLDEKALAEENDVNEPFACSGRLRLEVLQAYGLKNLQNKVSDVLLRPQDCLIRLLLGETRYETPVAQGEGTAPNFSSLNAVHEFSIAKGQSGRLLLHALAPGTLSDNVLGVAQFGLARAILVSQEKGAPIELSIPLSYADLALSKREPCGTVNLRLTFIQPEELLAASSAADLFDEDGVLTVCVHRCLNLKEVEKQQDPYVQLYISGQKFKTDIAEDGGRNPIFRQGTHSFKAKNGTESRLLLYVFDSGPLMDTLIGVAELNVQKLIMEQKERATRPVDGNARDRIDVFSHVVELIYSDEKMRSKGAFGSVEVSLSFVSAAAMQSFIPTPVPLSRPGRLTVQALKAYNLPQASLISFVRQDIYVKFLFNSHVYRSGVVEDGGQTPHFPNATTDFIVEDGDLSRLLVVVKSDALAHNPVLGVGALSVADIVNNSQSTLPQMTMSLPLRFADEKLEKPGDYGQIDLFLSFLSDNEVRERKQRLETPIIKGGKLRVEVVKAYDLRIVQTIGKQDPYVMLLFLGQVFKTSVAEDGGTSPTFSNAVKEFKVKSGESGRMVVRVIDYNTLTDKVIGVAEVGLGEATSKTGKMRLTIDLDYQDVEMKIPGSCGKVELLLDFQDEADRRRELVLEPFDCNGKLFIQVERAWDLPAPSKLQKATRYFKLIGREGEHVFETDRQSQHLVSPSFSNAVTELPVREGESGRLQVYAMGGGIVSDSVISATQIGLAGIVRELGSQQLNSGLREKTVSFPLEYKDPDMVVEGGSGSVELRFRLLSGAEEKQNEIVSRIPVDGELTITAHRAFDLRNIQALGKQDPYVELLLGDHPPWHSETAEDAGTNPLFRNAVRNFTLRQGDSGKLVVRVRDNNVLSDSLIGACQLDLTDILTRVLSTKRTLRETFMLTHEDEALRKQKNDLGRIELSFAFVDPLQKQREAAMGRPLEKEGVLYVSVPRAFDLPVVRHLGTQDPLVRVIFGHQELSSSVCNNGDRNPSFNSSHFRLDLKKGDPDRLIVRIVDQLGLGQQTVIGEVSLSVAEVVNDGAKIEDKVFSLSHSDEVMASGKGRTQPVDGKVVVSLSFEDKNELEKKSMIAAPFNQSGAILVHAETAYDLREVDKLWKQDPFLQFELNGQSFRSTAVRDGGRAVKFPDAKHVFRIQKGEMGLLRLLVYDDNTTKDTIIGATELDISSAVNSGKALSLSPILNFLDADLTRAGMAGKVQLKVEFLPEDVIQQQREGIEAMFQRKGRLTIIVNRGFDIKKRGELYVELYLAENPPYKSGVTVSQHSSPEFNYAASTFTVLPNKPGRLVVRLREREMLAIDQVLGATQIGLAQFVNTAKHNERKEMLIRLDYADTALSKREDMGWLELSLSFTDSEALSALSGVTKGTSLDESGSLRVQVSRAFGFNDRRGGSAIARFLFSGKKFESEKAKEKGSAVTFDLASHNFDVKKGDSSLLVIEILLSSLTSMEPLGAAAIDVSDLIKERKPLIETVGLCFADQTLSKAGDYGLVSVSLSFEPESIREKRLARSAASFSRAGLLQVEVLEAYDLPQQSSLLGQEYCAMMVYNGESKKSESSVGYKRGVTFTDCVVDFSTKKEGEGYLIIGLYRKGLTSDELVGATDVDITSLAGGERGRIEDTFELFYPNLSLSSPGSYGRITVRLSFRSIEELQQSVLLPVKREGELFVEVVRAFLEGESDNKAECYAKLIYNTDRFVTGLSRKGDSPSWQNSCHVFRTRTAEEGKITARLFSKGHLGTFSLAASGEIDVHGVINNEEAVREATYDLRPSEADITDGGTKKVYVTLRHGFTSKDVLERQQNVLERPLMKKGNLRVQVLRAFDLDRKFPDGEIYPFLLYNHKPWKGSSAKEGKMAPVFRNVTNDFAVVPGQSSSILVLEMMECPVLVGSEAPCGAAKIDLSTVVEEEKKVQTIFSLPFKDHDFKQPGDVGKVELALTFERAEEIGSTEVQNTIKIARKGTLRIQLNRAYGLPRLSSNQTIIVKVKLEQNQIWEIKANEGDVNPEFASAMHDFSLVPGMSSVLELHFYVERLVNNALIGTATVDISPFISEEDRAPVQKFHLLQPPPTSSTATSSGTNTCGTVDVTYQFMDSKSLAEEHNTGAAVFGCNAKIMIEVKSAQNLHNVETFGEQDPYVRLTLGGHNYESDVEDGAGRNPVFKNAMTQIQVKKGDNAVLALRIMDKQIWPLPDRLIAGCLVNMAEILSLPSPHSQSFTLSFADYGLEKPSKEGYGSVQVIFTFTLEGPAPVSFLVGEAVAAQYDNGLWYEGKIACANADGTYAVDFKDGDKSACVPLSSIKRLADIRPDLPLAKTADASSGSGAPEQKLNKGVSEKSLQKKVDSQSETGGEEDDDEEEGEEEDEDDAGESEDDESGEDDEEEEGDEEGEESVGEEEEWSSEEEDQEKKSDGTPPSKAKSKTQGSAIQATVKETVPLRSKDKPVASKR